MSKPNTSSLNLRRELETPKVDKRRFIESAAKIAGLSKYFAQDADLVEIADFIDTIVQEAEIVIGEITEGTFDNVTIKRNMKEMRKRSSELRKTCAEVQTLLERSAAAFDDVHHLLARYVDTGEPVVTEGVVSEAKRYENMSASDRVKVLKLIKSDAFLSHAWDTSTLPEKKRAEVIYNSYVLGDSTMERELANIK